jgi:hypothetical protein
MAEDFASTLHIELDYRREGQHAERSRRNFVDESYLYIPHIYWAYTTRRVLVMERIGGVKLNDLEGLTKAGYDHHSVALKSARIIPLIHLRISSDVLSIPYNYLTSPIWSLCGCSIPKLDYCGGSFRNSSYMDCDCTGCPLNSYVWAKCK